MDNLIAECFVVINDERVGGGYFLWPPLIAKKFELDDAVIPPDVVDSRQFIRFESLQRSRNAGYCLDDCLARRRLEQIRHRTRLKRFAPNRLVIHRRQQNDTAR